MNLNRVVFFSKEDLACFSMLKRVETILNEFNEHKIYCNINDIIELYHAKQYIDNNLRLDNWSNEQFESYKRKVQIIWSIINHYISSINIHNLESSLNEVMNNVFIVVGPKIMKTFFRKSNSMSYLYRLFEVFYC